jgi:hypothetical protein
VCILRDHANIRRRIAEKPMVCQWQQPRTPGFETLETHPTQTNTGGKEYENKVQTIAGDPVDTGDDLEYVPNDSVGGEQ